MAESAKPLMLVAIDDSEHSYYALDRTLDHLFVDGASHLFRLALVHARASPASALGVAGVGSGDFLNSLISDMKKSANKTVEKAKELCTKKKDIDGIQQFQSKELIVCAWFLKEICATNARNRDQQESIHRGGAMPFIQHALRAAKVENVQVEVMEGDPRNVMPEAVDKHHAALLVLGSHGYGAVKRAVLGSVSDHCAHHANCSVMIVKRPMNKPAAK